MTNFSLYLLAAGAGLAIVVQQALNAKVRVELDSALWAAVVSYVGGTVAVVAALLIAREPLVSGAAIARTPWYAWAGGFFGAVFICLSILLLPRLGAATVIALVVVGQMLGSLAFDHFGVLGLPVQEATPMRLAGAALLIAGVVLIRF